MPSFIDTPIRARLLKVIKAGTATNPTRLPRSLTTPLRYWLTRLNRLKRLKVKKLLDAIMQSRDFPGLAGSITIDSQRQAIKQLWFLKGQALFEVLPFN